ncbi:MAG TPA: tetratricopeptide repeat protein [Spirochaetia bacterium]|nr:tetratricopeptide repeat protein [Spirochaetia bacterium]
MRDYQSQPEFLSVMSSYMSGDRDAAEKAVAELLRKYPHDSSLQLLLGNIKYTVGLLKEASSHLEKAVELDPGLCQAYYRLGVCYVRMGKLNEALKAFRKNVDEKCGSHAMSFYWMGLINSFLGKDDDALEAFTLLHTESPESLLANFFLAQLRMRRNEHEEALRLLRELLAVSPDFAEVHYLMGQVYERMHLNTEAIQCFRKTLELNPEDKRARLEYENLFDVPPL